MNIISHRGLWRTAEQKNSAEAFRRSAESGFGTETDVRDAGGRLVVAHDPPQGGEPAWSEFVDIFSARGLPVAVNIKADGLGSMIAASFEGRGVPWFAFDMSVPEMVRFLRAGLPFYTRHSDFEPQPVMYDLAQGVWLDALSQADWFGEVEICAHVAAGKRVCVVSPELHGRDHRAQWQMLRAFTGAPSVTLCTDFPDWAREYFAR